MKVVIAGQGAWGKALYSLLIQNTKTVSFWERDTIIKDADLLVLAVPTEAIRGVLSFVSSQKLIVVNTTKSIEEKTNFLPFQIVQEVLGEGAAYLSLIGPGFSQEVLDKMPTLVNLGFFKEESVEVMRKLFETDYFRVQPTKSLEAIELAGAFKNIYAIAAGLAHGLGFGMNTRAQIITVALQEFYMLCKKLGFRVDDHAHPAVIGDLVLTCSSMQSRNFRFGSLLVQYKAENALKKVGATVEGYASISSLPYFIEKAKIELPLAGFVSKMSRSTDNKDIRKKFLEVVKRV